MPPPRLQHATGLSSSSLPRPTAIDTPRDLRLTRRAFSQSAVRNANLRTKTFKPPSALESLPSSTPPPYPYGTPQWYKQSAHGLYGSQTIQFGHNVSEKNEIKTLRIWHPNLKYKYLYSDALGKKIRVKVSTRVMRTIDKVGGLDEYVIGTGAGRIKDLGLYGWALRWVVLQKMEEMGKLEGREELKAEVERDRRIRQKGLQEVEEVEQEAAEGEPETTSEVVDDIAEQNKREEDAVTATEERARQGHMTEMPPVPEEKPGLLSRLRGVVGLRR